MPSGGQLGSACSPSRSPGRRRTATQARGPLAGSSSDSIAESSRCRAGEGTGSGPGQSELEDSSAHAAASLSGSGSVRKLLRVIASRAGMRTAPSRTLGIMPGSSDPFSPIPPEAQSSGPPGRTTGSKGALADPYAQAPGNFKLNSSLRGPTHGPGATGITGRFMLHFGSRHGVRVDTTGSLSGGPGPGTESGPGLGLAVGTPSSFPNPGPTFKLAVVGVVSEATPGPPSLSESAARKRTGYAGFSFNVAGRTVPQSVPVAAGAAPQAQPTAARGPLAVGTGSIIAAAPTSCDSESTVSSSLSSARGTFTHTTSAVGPEASLTPTRSPGPSQPEAASISGARTRMFAGSMSSAGGRATGTTASGSSGPGCAPLPLTTPAVQVQVAQRDPLDSERHGRRKSSLTRVAPLPTTARA
jgi:hypothetical protein